VSLITHQPSATTEDANEFDIIQATLKNAQSAGMPPTLLLFGVPFYSRFPSTLVSIDRHAEINPGRLEAPPCKVLAWLPVTLGKGHIRITPSTPSPAIFCMTPTRALHFIRSSRRLNRSLPGSWI
jgi:hypothetical protein